MLAAAAKDELLATSLPELFLAPLDERADRGAVLRETLRTYFKAHRNVSSTAVTLAVSRQTVDKRLCAIEKRLDRPIAMFALELELALRLEAHRRVAK